MTLLEKKELKKWVQKHNQNDLLLFLGAGDIWKDAGQIARSFEPKSRKIGRLEKIKATAL